MILLAIPVHCSLRYISQSCKVDYVKYKYIFGALFISVYAGTDKYFKFYQFENKFQTSTNPPAFKF